VAEQAVLELMVLTTAILVTEVLDLPTYFVQVQTKLVLVAVVEEFINLPGKLLPWDLEGVVVVGLAGFQLVKVSPRVEMGQ
jgi:hypothetical protein